MIKSGFRGGVRSGGDPESWVFSAESADGALIIVLAGRRMVAPAHWDVRESGTGDPLVEVAGGGYGWELTGCI
jgi:hypothetical protein